MNRPKTNEPIVSHRILFTIESLFSLGAAQQLKLLVDSLAQAGHEIHVAVLGERAFEPTDWADAGIKVYFLNGDDKTPLHTLRDGYYVARELRKLIHTLSPGIVHSWCGRAELLTLIATKDLPITPRWLKPKKPPRLISTELFLQPEKSLTRKAIENRMNTRVEQLIVPHETVRKHLVDNGHRQTRIDIVPNAASQPNPEINRDEARRQIRAGMNLPATSFLAGAVAPLAHRSRLKDLVWATDLLTCIGKDFHLLIIGKGSQLWRLKRFAALTEAKEHVHFLGHPDSTDSVLAGLNFYWHSHLLDPLPGPMLSAMANGIPAVSVHGDGTREIIRQQETGFAANLGARDEFARWTKFLIEKPGPALKLARQGQQFVQEQFKVSSMVDRYLAIYNR